MSTSRTQRWTVLVIASLVMMMGYIFWNIISPVSTTLKAPVEEGGLGWTAAEYGLYTSSYTILNLFLLMLFFGGVILDKCGIRFTGILATGSMLAGSIINYYAITAISPADYANMAFTFFGFIPEQVKVQVLISSLGFGLFGMGCDITGITVSKIITKWFRGKELASAMGTQVAMARLGTALAFSLSPVLVQHFGVTSPLAIGAGILLFGFVLFMVYCLFDRKFDALSSASTSNTDNSDDVFRFADFVTVVSNVGFWLIAIVCVLYYASIRTFMNFATDFMVNGFAIDKETAGWVVSLIPFGAIVLSPLFGILYDRTGRGTQMMTIGCMVLTVSLLLLNYPLTHAIWYVLSMMTLVGIAFSLVPAALWPTVPMMVPLKQLGTAYSIIYYIQNIGLMLVPMWVGNVIDRHTVMTTGHVDYTMPMLIFFGFGLLATILAAILIAVDKRRNYGLEQSNILPSTRIGRNAASSQNCSGLRPGQTD